MAESDKGRILERMFRWKYNRGSAAIYDERERLMKGGINIVGQAEWWRAIKTELGIQTVVIANFYLRW